jgi:CDP-glucose 4,6-dehydratase
MFDDIYKGKRVLVTGNTGFKGSWLTAWLLKLGAQVIGISKDVPTTPALFDVLNIHKEIQHYEHDVRDLNTVSNVILKNKPDFIFHLAAQAIVSSSYSDPIDTLTTNVIGTANILEALRSYDRNCIAIFITSDKCYDNVEWSWGYRESDSLGGKDIYSGSKGAAELIIKSYYHSYFKDRSKIKIATARAGNVIGGGDWAVDRIVPDCIRAWDDGKSVEIRSPKATRPWQHVLEPLSGYLSLAHSLFRKEDLDGESFNFGPAAKYNHSVKELIDDLSYLWEMNNDSPYYVVTGDMEFHEAGLLKLNCDKALSSLKWLPTLEYEDLISFTGTWYRQYYKGVDDMSAFTSKQIDQYVNIACKKEIEWTK